LLHYREPHFPYDPPSKIYPNVSGNVNINKEDVLDFYPGGENKPSKEIFVK